MPYIKKEDRFGWDEQLEPLIDIIKSEPISYGVMNYLITNMLLALPHNNYKEMQDIIGLIESVKQEFYRRVVAPYEDKKIEENGDVYR